MPGDHATQPADWDDQYLAGRWHYLHDTPESPRYIALARLLYRLAPGDRILDAGCGEGILRRYLDPNRAWRYSGLDHSKLALDRLRADYPDSKILLGPLSRLEETANERFDALVFSEVLYYLEDAAGLVSAGRSWLTPGGVLLISMYQPPPDHSWAYRVAATWRAIEALDLPELERASAHDEATGRRWHLRAYGVAVT